MILGVSITRRLIVGVLVAHNSIVLIHLRVNLNLNLNLSLRTPLKTLDCDLTQ
jgi:hypothetical protein